MTLHIRCSTSPRLSVTTSATVGPPRSMAPMAPSTPSCVLVVELRRASGMNGSVRTRSRVARPFSRMEASREGGACASWPEDKRSQPTPPCEDPPKPPPPPPLLLEVICWVAETSTFGGWPEASRGMLKLVSEDVAFLYIVPGVCCGDDGDAGPRGGLRGAGGCGPLLPPSGARIPTDGTGLRMPETCRMMLRGGGDICVWSRSRCWADKSGGDSDRAPAGFCCALPPPQ